jgi:hypothetical protein
LVASNGDGIQLIAMVAATLMRGFAKGENNEKIVTAPD